MTTMVYAGQKKSGQSRPRNRRIIDGIEYIQCQKCGEWKEAIDGNYYRYGGFLRSPCKACAAAKRREKQTVCKHDGCTTEIASDTLTGYCRDHYYLHIQPKREKAHCSNCGAEISHQSTTGLCQSCYVSTGKIKEINANNGRIAGDALPRPAEFYSRLGELHEPMGVAPRGNGWITFKDGPH